MKTKESKFQKRNKPIIIEKKEQNKTAPAEISLTILTVWLYFGDKWSDISSIAVLKSSADKTNENVKKSIAYSKADKEKKDEKNSTYSAMTVCILKFLSLSRQYIMPFIACLKLFKVFISLSIIFV